MPVASRGPHSLTSNSATHCCFGRPNYSAMIQRMGQSLTVEDTRHTSELIIIHIYTYAYAYLSNPSTSSCLPTCIIIVWWLEFWHWSAAYSEPGLCEQQIRLTNIETRRNKFNIRHFVTNLCISSGKCPILSTVYRTAPFRSRRKWVDYSHLCHPRFNIHHH